MTYEQCHTLQNNRIRTCSIPIDPTLYIRGRCCRSMICSLRYCQYNCSHTNDNSICIWHTFYPPRSRDSYWQSVYPRSTPKISKWLQGLQYLSRLCTAWHHLPLLDKWFWIFCMCLSTKMKSIAKDYKFYLWNARIHPFGWSYRKEQTADLFWTLSDLNN